MTSLRTLYTSPLKEIFDRYQNSKYNPFESRKFNLLPEIAGGRNDYLRIYSLAISLNIKPVN